MRATSAMLAISLALGLGLPAGRAVAASPTAADSLRADALQAYIVVFEEAPAAGFRGFDRAAKGRPALAGTSPAVTGARKYDARSSESLAYVDYLDDLRRSRLNDAAIALMRPVEPTHVYRHALNGMAVELTAAEAERIASLPGVRTVRPAFTRYLMTDRSPSWIRADQVWSENLFSDTGSRGENVIVGVIDSGLNRNHVAFAGDGLVNPLPGGYVGHCVENPGSCNGKLVGLWDFTTGDGTGDPVDDDGHGTHTASIAVGNRFNADGGFYSGIAPRAHLIAYKACPGDACPGAAILASIDQAVDDGVDVINYSLGSRAIDPWAAVGNAGADDAEAFLFAREAGIVVAVAAGDNGPDPGTLGSPANAPWVLAVAAATHDRDGPGNRLADFSGRGPVVPLGVVKPDITAPGVNIRAAGNADTTGMAEMSGTSMAAPHLAGAAALLLSLRPSYGVDEVISALMLTARPTVSGPGGVATPHDHAVGMVDVAMAANASIYLRMPPSDFAMSRANPYASFHQLPGAEQINLPSLAHGACFRTCTLERTFSLMTGRVPGRYRIGTLISEGATITPSVSSFETSEEGQRVAFTFNVDNPALVGQWVYGTVLLVHESGYQRPVLRLPVAIYVSPFSNAAAESQTDPFNPLVNSDRGQLNIGFSGMVPMPNARFSTSGLVAPVTSTQDIAVDPTGNDPYDTGSNTFLRLVQVPATVAGQAPVKYRLTASTGFGSQDIDLFVGRDANGDGQAASNEELCVSEPGGSRYPGVHPTSAESCVVGIYSQDTPTSYWVLVQNHGGPGTNVRVDTVLLPITVSDTSRLVASGPGRTAANETLFVRIAYDDPGLVNGDSRHGVLFIQPSPESKPIEVSLRLTRVGVGLAPFALAENVGRAVTLPVGSSHDSLYFDVPPHATSVEFTTTNSTGNVDLYVAHDPSPFGPTISPAPPWNNQPAFRAATGSGNETVVLSGANLLPGRYYVVPSNAAGATVSATVTARIVSQGTKPAFLPGQYANPYRSGHGLFVDFAGEIGNPDQWVTVWYSYLENSTPTWYYSQNPVPGPSGIWKAELFRVVWNGSAAHAVDVGDVIITPTGPEAMNMSFNLDGHSGFQPMVRVGGGSCPQFDGQALDVTGHWYSPTAPGFGYSYQVTGGSNPQEVFIPYVYDAQGFPRWLYGQKDFDPGVATFDLQWFSGFPPLYGWNPLVGTAAGTGTRSLATNNVTIMSVDAPLNVPSGAFTGHWVESRPVAPLSQRKLCQ